MGGANNGAKGEGDAHANANANAEEKANANAEEKVGAKGEAEMDDGGGRPTLSEMAVWAVDKPATVPSHACGR